ncbi:MAG: adenylosuccinate lyase [Bdellovibrionaceae bacterium]|nr:adenylosuccinate lyase [Pseudobdellovibrionaceae bacterium]
MIERYTRQEMGNIWRLENRFECMRRVEVAVAQAQAELKIIPVKAAQDISKKSKFSVDRILEIEKTTKHDVIAFVSNLAENVGENGRFIHYGLTSSDVLDTALSLQILEAAKVLNKSLNKLLDSFKKKIEKHKSTLCSGRTHGMHAEPTTFGLKLAGHMAEFERHQLRFLKAMEQMAIGKLSGAVGTYSMQSEKVEEAVCKKLGLVPEVIATQVIPRDRHAEVFTALAMLGAGLERLAIEFRHLQRTEVAEVYEGFSSGQKGSSAMPHKKNPISSENITGVARLLRSYQQAAMEDIALWHERDISHSSVERVIFPDAFILCDYALDRMANVLENLQVDKERMVQNMQFSQGQLFSSHVLLSLVNQGLSREEAYRHVQRVSHSLKAGESFKDKLLKDKEVKSYFSKKELEEIFSGQRHTKQILKVISRMGRKSNGKERTALRG